MPPKPSLVWLLVVAALLVCLLNFYCGSALVHSQNDAPTRSGAWATKKKANQQSPRVYSPTDHACDGYDGIYHIAMTDILGGVGTSLIQLVLGQLLYAEDHNLKPWIFLNNQSQVFYDPVVHSPPGVGVHMVGMVGRNASYLAARREGHRHWRDWIPGPPNTSLPVTRQSLYFPGTGVWDHYFEPVSDFVPGDRSCESKLYVTMDLYLITPGIHGFDDRYATRAWRYDYLPEYSSQPHKPLHEWLWPQRELAHRTLTRYIKFRPHLKAAAERVNPRCNLQANPCLGLHIRHSDKAAGRRVVPVEEFLPFVLAFEEASGGRGQIYVATDSSHVIFEIQQTWPSKLLSRIHSLGRQAARSNNTRAVFDMGESHHRINQEALIEILALSQCQFLVHGFSALSESSIWINLDLHYRSVNLEDPMHIDNFTFSAVVRQSTQGTSVENLPRPAQTDRWWEELLRNKKSPPVDGHDQAQVAGCFGDGHDAAILHIATVAEDAGAGRAFFTSILNQLMLAEHLGLRPWIHLSSCSATACEAFYDPKLDSIETTYNPPLPLNTSSTVRPFFDSSAGGWQIHGAESSRQDFQGGQSIWELYFEPVAPWLENGTFCAHNSSKAILTALGQDQVSNELELQTPWAARAWRYDGVKEAIWHSQDKSKILKDKMWSMRSRAHDIVAKYFLPRKQIMDRVDKVNNPTKNGERCMAVHVRATDVYGKYRRKVTADKYIPYMETYAMAAMTRKTRSTIFIGTDSSRALRYLLRSVSAPVKRMLRHQGDFVVRSSSKSVPPRVLDDHHRVNSEMLIDVYAMARCHAFLHSSSTVAEAVIYVNPGLHNRSVNMDDPDRLSLDEFQAMFLASW